MIGAISDHLGLSRDTPRFYEKLSLLKTNRAVSGIREYSEGDIARLKLIICFKESGIPARRYKAVFEARRSRTWQRRPKAGHPLEIKRKVGRKPSEI